MILVAVATLFQKQIVFGITARLPAKFSRLCAGYGKYFSHQKGKEDCTGVIISVTTAGIDFKHYVGKLP